MVATLSDARCSQALSPSSSVSIALAILNVITSRRVTHPSSTRAAPTLHARRLPFGTIIAPHERPSAWVIRRQSQIQAPKLLGPLNPTRGEQLIAKEGLLYGEARHGFIR
jgi:hypothetical protein